MIRTLFLIGQTDIDSQLVSRRVEDDEGSEITTELVGVLPILSYVWSDRTLAANSTSILVRVRTAQPPTKEAVNVFNLVGDSDASITALHNIQAIINVTRPRRCFNPPVNVFRTSRGRLSKSLSDIPGCTVPAVESVDPATYEELLAACNTFACWPLIVRARGFHGGENMILLRDAAELESFRGETWLYTGIFLIEFVEYINEDGLYQKNRVVMIDGVPYIRHAIFTNHWSIHSGSRDVLMDDDVALCQREKHFLADFRDTGIKKHARVFKEIYRRIGLDVFGIDFALVDGKILIFEANACMNFVADRYDSDSQYAYLDSYVLTIRRALKKMLIKG